MRYRQLLGALQVSILSVALPGLLLRAGPAQAESVFKITGQEPGAQPFIALITAVTSSPLASVSFAIPPAASSFTHPISATYPAAYLLSHHYLHQKTVTVPVWGLYAGATNNVVMTYNFVDGTVGSATVPVTTSAYTDPCGSLGQAVFKQYRTASTGLSFDYFLLKNSCSRDTPVILDTDGNVRWASPSGVATLSSAYFRGSIYESDGATGINRVGLDGRVLKIGDYASSNNVTSTGHHNIDPGRDGMVLEVNTTTQTESNNIEIDTNGKVLNTWDLGAIISAAMVAGGDDPSQFVYPVGTDWFHNNSTTYSKVDNTLIVSSRENFVIAVDYDTPPDGVKKIHWILGDTTKHWAQFPSLRAFALTLSPNTIAPVGQHGVAIDLQGNLRMLDDGLQSLFQKPAGVTRTYSAGRAYKINLASRTATEVFSLVNRMKKYTPYCGSDYEDAAQYNLIDYPALNKGTATEVEGFGPNFTVVFDLILPERSVCVAGWNAIPIHLDNVVY